MKYSAQHRSWTRNLSSWAALAALPIAIMFVLMATAQSAQAQTFKVLYSFTGAADGAEPVAGLAIDRAGNLYGTASIGGSGFDGTVFKLHQAGSGWMFNVLYSFEGGDGSLPMAVSFGPDGTLYGTTLNGGTGEGVVFNLKPQASPCKTALCPWAETVLYRFKGGTDGEFPFSGAAFDQAGNIYGTTYQGGGNNCQHNGCGTVYKLTRSDGWAESVLYSFTGGSDGSKPIAGVTLDQTGNLYGTASFAGSLHYGVVFQLAPSGGGWTENVLYAFEGGSDGAAPYAGLILDGLGNLYGASSIDGSGGGGAALQLTPSNGSWTFSVLYDFVGGQNYQPSGPAANLTMDKAGNLYGATYRGGSTNCGGYGCGTVFKLTPSSGGWSYSVLHVFTGTADDGANPQCALVFDQNGKLYGTTASGGANGVGTVFEITP